MFVCLSMQGAVEWSQFWSIVGLTALPMKESACAISRPLIYQMSHTMFKDPWPVPMQNRNSEQQSRNDIAL